MLYPDFRQGCRASAVVGLSWARHRSHRGCPCACKKVTTLWLTQPHLSPFGQGAATQAAQPSPAPTHSSTTRARPTGGKTASARNPRCQEIWQASTASSTYGGMIRYPPRLPPTMCQNSKASKISCCPSIPSRGVGPPESVIHSFATSVEGACNFQIPSPFLLTPHRPDPSHWELRACSPASPQITEFLHKLKETAPEETLPCINPPS
jgi:hypothetical protein